jgi:hypothetical protein
MSNPTRPLASSQRAIIGTARLAELGNEVELLALADDLAGGGQFYVIRGKGESRPFGVWPNELTDIAWAMPLAD